MRTSFDIVLLLFTTCLVTGFRQFSTFFENAHPITTTLRQAHPTNPEEAHIVTLGRRVSHMVMAQYILIIVWLAFSLYLEVNLSRRGQRDIATKPLRVLQGYTVVSIGLLLYLIISMIYVSVAWTRKVVRALDAGKLDISQEMQQFVRTMDSLLGINYIFSIGIGIFIIFIVVQLWEETTINEFRIRLEGKNTIDVSSLDGKFLQKYHFGSGQLSKKTSLEDLLA